MGLLRVSSGSPLTVFRIEFDALSHRPARRQGFFMIEAILCTFDKVLHELTVSIERLAVLDLSQAVYST